MRISDWSSDVCSSDLLALDIGIHCFNIESEYELELVDATARLMNKRARIALRVNPDVDAKTPPYISTGLKKHKFGVDIPSAERLYRRAATMDGIEIDALAHHIGPHELEEIGRASRRDKEYKY